MRIDPSDARHGIGVIQEFDRLAKLGESIKHRLRAIETFEDEIVCHLVDLFASCLVLFVEFDAKVFVNSFSTLEFGTDFRCCVVVGSVDHRSGSVVVGLVAVRQNLRSLWNTWILLNLGLGVRKLSRNDNEGLVFVDHVDILLLQEVTGDEFLTSFDPWSLIFER